MRNHSSKKRTGSLIFYIIPKSYRIRQSLIIFTFLFLYNAMSYCFGSDLNNPKLIASYTNSVFPDTIELDLYTPTEGFILESIVAHFGYLKLQASSSSINYSTDFYFNSNATSSLDPGYDTALYGGTIPAFSIYSYLVQNDDGTAFTIQTLSDTDMENITVSLGLNASQGQEVTISIFETDLPDTIDVYLEDTFNNTLTLLNDENDYIFTVDSYLSGGGRFYLRFQSNALSTSEPSIDNLDIFFNTNEKNIVIDGQLQHKTKLSLLDINGRLITSMDLDISKAIQYIDVSHVNTGIYLVEFSTSESRRRIQKLIIH